MDTQFFVGWARFSLSGSRRWIRRV